MRIYDFDDSAKNIRIYKHDLPSPWINYLSNGNIHAFVSQAGGGFAWWKDPTKRRLTRYRMYNLPIDSPGFYVYVRKKDGTVWSPTFRPCNTPLDKWYAQHSAGVSTFYSEKDGIAATLTLFASPDYDSIIWKLDIENKAQTNEELDIFAYTEISQQDWMSEHTYGYYWRHMHKCWYNEKLNSMMYFYHFPQCDEDFEEMPLLYFASDKKAASYSGDRDRFMGDYRMEDNPLAVEKGECTNDELLSGEPCAALHIKLNVPAKGNENVNFYLGVVPGAIKRGKKIEDDAKEIIKKLTASGEAERQLEKLGSIWDNYYSRAVCSIKDKNAERQINIWGPINAMDTARYSRAINVEAPGVRNVGYRDSAQDMLAVTMRCPEMTKDMLYLLLSKQFADGSALPGFSKRKNVPEFYKIRSDVHLWPVLTAYSLACETDIDFLDDKIPYLARDTVSPEGNATVWEHLLSAIEFSNSNRGEHGLLLTLNGDWNDIIHKFSEKGKGESVFASMQYVYTLDKMIELAEAKGEDAEKLIGYRDSMKESLIKHAWNGKWWYRCYKDDGTPVGAEDDEFGKIWLNPQSWSVICDVGTYEQKISGMENAYEYLHTKMGMQLLTPGFETYPEVEEPFSSYNPGCGENGAIFCHAHSWAVIAEAMLGNGERAWSYYNDLVPHNCIERVGVDVYKSDPYSWVSNIVGIKNNKYGWGNVGHITGTSPWMNIAAWEYLLGIRPDLGGIRIDPCIPKDWDGFSVKRVYNGCELCVEVINDSHCEKGVKRLVVDGKEYETDRITKDMTIGKSRLTIKAYM